MKYKKRRGKVKSDRREYQIWYQKGIELFDQGRFADALIQWKKIPKDKGNKDRFPKMAAAYFHVGIERQKQGDLKGATHYLSQATNYQPNIAIYHYYLGLVHQRNGEISRAASSYKAAQSLDQENPRFKYHYALALLDLGETQISLDLILKNIKEAQIPSEKLLWQKGLIYAFIRTGKEQKARTLLQELGSNFNYKATSCLINGISYLILEDFSRASHALAKLAERDTQEIIDSGAFYYALGIMHLKDRDLTRALEMWEKAYSQGIIPATQLLRLGYELRSQELFSSGNDSAAMESIHSLLVLSPEDKMVKKTMLYFHWQKGNSCATEGKFDRAIQEWQAALSYQKNNTSLIHNIALAYEKTGDLEEANKYWHKCIQYRGAGLNEETGLSREKISLAHRHLAQNYKKMHQWAQARDEFRALLKINPNDLFALKELGKLFFAAGEEYKALPFFKKAYKIDPHDSDTTTWIARVYEVMGLFTQAISYLESSLAINAQDHIARAFLGRVLILEAKDYRARKKYDKALEVLLKGVLWDLQDHHLYAHLGNTYLFLAKNNEASDAFQKALEFSSWNPKIAVIIGRTYLYHHKEEAAQRYFQKAEEISSPAQLSQTLKDIASACLNYHKPKLSKEYLDKFFDHAQVDLSDWMEMCEDILDYDYPALAIKYLKNAIKLYPETPRLYFLLSWAYNILGKTRKSKANLYRAQRIAEANKDQELIEEIQWYLDAQEFN
jgi:tetratricopeptide (TPR) repeat protein